MQTIHLAACFHSKVDPFAFLLKMVNSFSKYKVIFSFVSDRPSAPKNLSMTSTSDDRVSLQWEHSKSDEKHNAECANWSKVGTVTSDSTAYKTDRLSQGSSYVVRVSAENSLGMSKLVELAKPITIKLPYCEWLGACLIVFVVSSLFGGFINALYG